MADPKQPFWPQIPEAFPADTDKDEWEKGVNRAWAKQWGKKTGDTNHDIETNFDYPTRQVQGGAPFMFQPNKDATGRWDQWLVKTPGVKGDTWKPFNFAGSKMYQGWADELNSLGHNPKTLEPLPDLNEINIADLRELHKWYQEDQRMHSPESATALQEVEGVRNLKARADDAVSLIRSGQISPSDLNYLQQNWNNIQKLVGPDGKTPDPRRELFDRFKGDVDAIVMDGAKIPGLRSDNQTAAIISDGLSKLIPEGVAGTLIAGGMETLASLGKAYTDGHWDINNLTANLSRFDNELTGGLVRKVFNDTTNTGGRIAYPEPVREEMRQYEKELQNEPRINADGTKGVGLGYDDPFWSRTPNLLDTIKKPGEPGYVGAPAMPAAAADTSKPIYTLPADIARPKDQTTPKPPDQGEPKAEMGVTKAEEEKIQKDVSEGIPPANLDAAWRWAKSGLKSLDQWLNPPADNQPTTGQPQKAPIAPTPAPTPTPKPQVVVNPPKPSPTPTRTPTPAPTPSPTPAPTPATEFNPAHPSRTPKPATAGTAYNESELPPNAEMGAPLGSPDYRMPRLVRQEHVDALQPGTPFYWADHEDPYVKV